MRNKKSKTENHLVTLSSENVKSDQESQNTLYNTEFVEKILREREEIKEGKGVKIDIENLWK